MRVLVEKDFSSEREAFVSFLDNRNSTEDNQPSEAMKSENAELAKKFEKFLQMEEFIKQRRESGHCGKFKGKHLWRFYSTINNTAEGDVDNTTFGKGWHCHRADHHWGKHGRHGYFGKFGHWPYDKHGHHGHHGHGHHGHHGYGHHGKFGHHGKHGHGHGKHAFFMAMFNDLPLNATEEEIQRLIESGRNPSPPPATSNAEENQSIPCGMPRRHRHCFKHMMRSAPKQTDVPAVVEPQAPVTETAPGTEENPQNLAVMVENIDINKSPRPNAMPSE